MGNKTFLRFSFLTFFLTVMLALRVSAQVNPYDIRPFNNKYAASHTEIPESLVPIDASYISSAYQWESSTRPTDGFVAIPGATLATYTFSAPLAQTTYFRRKFRIGRVEQVYSNVIKIEVVSVNWEDIRYIREHDIRISGLIEWTAIDQLTIGPKMQTTTYLDGLNRKIQIVSRETATPDASASTFGDVVHFSLFDEFGRKTKNYLPFTTHDQLGKYKTLVKSKQETYYTNVYNDNAAFSQALYDNSPLNRVTEFKSAGESSSSNPGESIVYELNDATEEVQIFTIAYNAGSIPISLGTYPSNKLTKSVQEDVNGKKSILYFDNLGQEILSKFQDADNPSLDHDGWICTYSIYDEYGQLRCRIQPEGIKWLSEHSWSFSGTVGQKVLNEQCFIYEYDAKKRLIRKKLPGQDPLILLYDKRDRVTFVQDGVQRQKSPAEWGVTLFDDLDRPVLSALHYTSKSASTIQSELDAASGSADVTISSLGVTVNLSYNPITSVDLNSSSLTTILSVNFFDSYNFPNANTFNTNFDNALAYATGGEPIISSQRTLSVSTGRTVRVLGSNDFLTTTTYYDEKGRLIQQLEQNIKLGIDITTNQYLWDGSQLSSNTKHTASGTSQTNYSVIRKNIFDVIGRVISVERKYGTNAFIPIVTHTYDDFSRLKSKRLAPGYTGTGKTELETLSYSYNVQNKLTGINKEFALKSSGYSKWDHFFGMFMGYENEDNILTTGRLDGKASGFIWNTQGDDAQRKFEFSYDNAGRLSNASFTEKKIVSDSWSNTNMDFSSTGSAGRITYDLNGNIQHLQHKGVIPGATSPIIVDDLQYEYADFSNRLLKVTDNGTAGSANGKSGDFKDGINGSSDDYVYDENGNVIVDLNKNIKELSGVLGTKGIHYNHLNLPDEIRVAGKGVIKITYDADGRKLKRQFIQEGSSPGKSIYYVNAFVYEDADLQYINFEEGRIRAFASISENNGLDYRIVDGTFDLPGGKRGSFEYYIRDYQANVRMVLSIGQHVGGNTCTMESARAANEEGVFGQVDASGNPTAANEVAARYPTASIPGAGWTDNSSSYVSRIGALAASKIGPNTLLKVMAGDKISTTTQYYYPNSVTNGTGTSVITDILGSLVQAIGGGAATNAVTKAAAGNIGTLLNSSTPLATATSPDANNTAGSAPKAYLTLLFFDERFNFVEESSQTLRVSQAGNGADPLTILNIKAPKNGYAYIYVSNESSEHVYFDNLQVSHTRGHIVEENHYYAYGLRIASISSKKLLGADESSANVRRGYNGKELIEDAEIGLYEYGYRSYDPQIGRFIQADPKTDTYFPFSPYAYAVSDPISFVDYLGLGPETGLTAATAKTLSNVVIKSTIRTASSTANSALSMASMLGRIAAIGANIATSREADSKDVFWIPVSNTQFMSLLNRGGITGSGVAFNKQKGAMMEDLYARSHSLFKNRWPTGSAGRIPDFLLPTAYADEFTKGAAAAMVIEVKATKSVQFTAQIRGEIDAAAEAELVGLGFKPRAGELGIAEFILVSFEHNLNSGSFGYSRIRDYCTSRNVSFSTSYPEYNPVTGDFRFSFPKKQNVTAAKGIYIGIERLRLWWSGENVQLDFSAANKDTNEDGSDF